MTKKITFSFLVLTLILSGCGLLKGTTSSKDNEVKFTIMQINDVYEIAPLEGGKVGGMARVATLKQELLKENPNTFLVLAGDFVSPSVIGTLKLRDERIAGKQMVECMNLAGVDMVTFGNHEFDIKENELQNRINESKFEWISANVWHKYKDGKKARFSKKVGNDSTFFPESKILEIKNASGSAVKVGVVTATLPFNKADYVAYDDFMLEAKKQYDNNVVSKCNFSIGLTHLALEDDKKLAEMLPNLQLIMGGHEHNNMLVPVGKLHIAKADANAKTAYIHRFTYNVKTKKITVNSELRKLDESVALDAKTTTVVKNWNDVAYQKFKEQGFNPEEIIANINPAMDATEIYVRSNQSTIGKSITSAMLYANKDCQVALMNSGSIRIDDKIEGNITQLDVIRVMPFGGGLVKVDMKGSLLKKILDISVGNAGNGGYLQYGGVELMGKDSWVCQGVEIQDERVYKVVLNDFLFSGKEKNFDFLTDKNPDITNVVRPQSNEIQKDIRLVWIQYLKDFKGK